MKRTDYRPNNNRTSTISDKDRETIRKNKEYDVENSRPNESRKAFLKRNLEGERKLDYEKAKERVKNPPKKDWYQSQSNYNNERALDKKVVKAKGKKRYIDF